MSYSSFARLEAMRSCSIFFRAFRYLSNLSLRSFYCCTSACNLRLLPLGERDYSTVWNLPFSVPMGDGASRAERAGSCRFLLAGVFDLALSLSLRASAFTAYFCLISTYIDSSALDRSLSTTFFFHESNLAFACAELCY
jgi:hypothetical protein